MHSYYGYRITVTITYGVVGIPATPIRLHAKFTPRKQKFAAPSAGRLHGWLSHVRHAVNVQVGLPDVACLRTGNWHGPIVVICQGCARSSVGEYDTCPLPDSLSMGSLVHTSNVLHSPIIIYCRYPS